MDGWRERARGRKGGRADGESKRVRKTMRMRGSDVGRPQQNTCNARFDTVTAAIGGECHGSFFNTCMYTVIASSAWIAHVYVGWNKVVDVRWKGV
jgi:hypothetical protein